MKPQEDNMPIQTKEEIAQIKEQITYYFSQELQYDESIMGSMKRKQIEKMLINWANENK
jgi:hypothetical protein